MKIGHFSAEYWFYAYWSIFGPITRNRVYLMMHIPRGKFSHFHACAILYQEQQLNCKPGLDRRYRNLGKSVSQNHWQYVSIYNLQRKPDTIVSQANKSKDHQFNVEGRIVEGGSISRRQRRPGRQLQRVDTGADQFLTADCTSNM